MYYKLQERIFPCKMEYGNFNLHAINYDIHAMVHAKLCSWQITALYLDNSLTNRWVGTKRWIDWSSIFHRNEFHAHEIRENTFVYIGNLVFVICAWPLRFGHADLARNPIQEIEVYMNGYAALWLDALAAPGGSFRGKWIRFEFNTCILTGSPPMPLHTADNIDYYVKSSILQESRSGSIHLTGVLVRSLW